MDPSHIIITLTTIRLIILIRLLNIMILLFPIVLWGKGGELQGALLKVLAYNLGKYYIESERVQIQNI